MKIKKNDMLEAYGKLILVAILVILLVVFLVRYQKTEDPQETTSAIETTEQTTGTTETERQTETTLEEENPLREDADPEIHTLMERFFQAKFDCDIESLRQIVNPIDGYTEESLYEDRYGMEENSLMEIENYEVKSCYTKDGLVSGTYFVWVYVEIKYVHAATPAPALFRMYVCTDENGYYIYNGSLEGEISAYRDEMSAKADVLELVAMINQRYQEAMNHDEDLLNIVLSMTGEQESEEQSTQEGQEGN